jgi:hypothetical protein
LAQCIISKAALFAHTSEPARAEALAAALKRAGLQVIRIAVDARSESIEAAFRGDREGRAAGTDPKRRQRGAGLVPKSNAHRPADGSTQPGQLLFLTCQ